METRNIGSLSVTLAGLGCNNFGMRTDRQSSLEIINAAWESGLRFFDTADLYGNGQSEEWLGEALNARRQQAVIATKFGWPWQGHEGGSRANVLRSAEASLRRLGTDYIDLYYLHRPDPATPIGETLQALDELVQAGKVREIGCSNISPDQLETGLACARALGVRSFAAVEAHYNLLYREPEHGLLQICVQNGLAFIPFFPLASGLLTGKYDPAQQLPDDSRLAWVSQTRQPAPSAAGTALERTMNWHGHGAYDIDVPATLSRLRSFSQASGRAMAELALGWLAAQPAVASIITGATSTAQACQNAAACQTVLLPAEMKYLSTGLLGAMAEDGHG